MSIKDLTERLLGGGKIPLQKYGLIIRIDGVYEPCYISLPEGDECEMFVKGLVCNKESNKIVEVRKIPQKTSEKELEKRVNLLNKRQRREEKEKRVKKK